MNAKKKLAQKREEFKRLENEVEVADILLIRYKGRFNLFGKSVQKITNSYWNHTALVFSAAKKNVKLNPLFHNTIIVEALAKGIELHKIQNYTERPDKYDLGVKRLPDLNINDRRRIRGYMMQNVDVPYDYPQLLSMVLGYLTGRYKDYFDKKDAYICSAFIQSAFHHALKGKRNVFFKKNTGKKDSELLLGNTTPKDIAVSDVTEWVYNQHY